MYSVQCTWINVHWIKWPWYKNAFGIWSNKSYVSHLWWHWDYFQVENDSQYIHICGCFAFFSCFGLFKTIKIFSCLLLLVINMQVPVKISVLLISSYFFPQGFSHKGAWRKEVLKTRLLWIHLLTCSTIMTSSTENNRANEPS